MKPEHKLKIESTIDFILAGKAVFTVKNKETNNRFTFKVRKSKDGKVHFVSVLTGTDNESSYSFIGTIFNNNLFRYSNKSHIKNTATSVKGFTYIFAKLIDKSINPVFEFYHEGKCGRCGRTLTVPESIESGYGPECIHLVSKRPIQVMQPKLNLK